MKKKGKTLLFLGMSLLLLSGCDNGKGQASHCNSERCPVGQKVELKTPDKGN